MLRVIRAYLLYTWGGLHRLFGNQNNVAHEFHRAVYYFRRAYEINPAMEQARLARAVILWRELEQLDEALQDLDALLESNPDYGEALFNRALIRQQQGHYRLALEDLTAYLRLPDDTEYRDLALRIEPLLLALLEGGMEAE